MHVGDSESFCQFGKKFLGKPGPKSGIKGRTFYDLPDDIIKERGMYRFSMIKTKIKRFIIQVRGVKTLTGINSIFTYIVSPSGEVWFRKFSCFCVYCSKMDFGNCSQKKLVGIARLVVSAGENIRKEVD